MLSTEHDIEFHYCADAHDAVAAATRIQPTIILQDLILPEIDGLELTRSYRNNPGTEHTPIIVLSAEEDPQIKAEAFRSGASDYLVKLPDRVELVARIRHHSLGYIHLLERNHAYAALEVSQRRLAAEMEAGIRYVESQLPKPMKGPVQLDFRYIPSAELGGDSLGYHWLDPEHLAIFLLDVTGHGLASALLGVTIASVLRSRSLPITDFREPAQVLQGLNSAFKMEEHENKCFTIWYGVYHAPTRVLTWAGGGHPPALLLTPDLEIRKLASQSPILGVLELDVIHSDSCFVLPGSQFYLFSDGVYEIRSQEDGKVGTFNSILKCFSEPCAGESRMDRLWERAHASQAGSSLDDDFSIIEALF
jgi:sigma-B regulation protein RsbU (phosphoserine phosphatase)